MTPHDEQPVRHRVFIVDDHPLILKALTQMLNAQPNLQVVGTATSAEAAFATIPSTEPELLVVDYSLPGMNGVEFVKHAAHSWPGLPCLVMSSWSGKHVARASLNAGAKEYIVKGDPDELLDAILRTLA